MSCSTISASIALDCLGISGGIEKVFIANGPSSSIVETSGNITEISVDGTPLAPADFFSFGTPKQVSSITEVPAISQENGTIAYQQDLTLIMNKLDADKRNQILLMAQSNQMIVVAKDNNSTYWVIGAVRGAYLGSATATSGVLFSDRSGYELVLSSLEAQPMFTIDGSIVEA